MADARHVSECGSGLGILKEGWRSGPRGAAGVPGAYRLLANLLAL